MFFINPFIYGGAGGDFESIATVTVGSGGASSIEFTSIPGTYQHLQVRVLSRSAAADSIDAVTLRVNTDSGSNYARHGLTGNGTSASAFGLANSNIIGAIDTTAANSTASIFGAIIIDLLDYASTSKNKTFRILGGADQNGTGTISLQSGLWMSTSAVTSLRLANFNNNNFVQHTTAALYGIKAP